MLTITYNLLNQPQQVKSGSTVKHKFAYLADGRKLHSISNPANDGGLAYIGTSVFKIYRGKYDGFESTSFSAGRIVRSGNSYIVQYHITDHLGSVRVVLNQSMTILEQNDYYPFGLRHPNSALKTSANRYRYNGKEEIAADATSDYGARQYSAEFCQWLQVDPLAEKYYSWSPYNFCVGNPLKYVDMDGNNPIYDVNGNLIGTDDGGLQGEAIIMKKVNFVQGMAHDEAMGYNLGEDGLASEEAKTAYEESFNGLKDRPDWDGKLTLAEANDWYRNGNGQPLFVALSKIDLSGIYSLGEKYVGQVKAVNLLLNSGSLNDGLVYGSITLKRYPNHQVKAFSDEYNFEMHNPKNPLNWGRNAETVIGKQVAGNGIPFEINIYGSSTLKPILPWIK